MVKDFLENDDIFLKIFKQFSILFLNLQLLNGNVKGFRISRPNKRRNYILKIKI